MREYGVLVDGIYVGEVATPDVDNDGLGYRWQAERLGNDISKRPVLGITYDLFHKRADAVEFLVDSYLAEHEDKAAAT
jgi:hypothetical protein